MAQNNSNQNTNKSSWNDNSPSIRNTPNDSVGMENVKFYVDFWGTPSYSYTIDGKSYAHDSLGTYPVGTSYQKFKAVVTVLNYSPNPVVRKVGEFGTLIINIKEKGLVKGIGITGAGILAGKPFKNPIASNVAENAGSKATDKTYDASEKAIKEYAPKYIKEYVKESKQLQQNNGLGTPYDGFRHKNLHSSTPAYDAKVMRPTRTSNTALIATTLIVQPPPIAMLTPAVNAAGGNASAVANSVIGTNTTLENAETAIMNSNRVAASSGGGGGGFNWWNLLGAILPNNNPGGGYYWGSGSSNNYNGYSGSSGASGSSGGSSGSNSYYPPASENISGGLYNGGRVEIDGAVYGDN